MKQRKQIPHGVLGLVLVLTAGLIITSISTSYSLAQSGSHNLNQPLNVNINNTPPVFSGHVAWELPQDGSLSPFSFSGLGDELTGLVNKYTQIIVNVNVLDDNGYSVSTMNVASRIIRTIDGGTNVNRAGTDIFLGISANKFEVYPLAFPWSSQCTDLGATANPKEHTWRCVGYMYYYSHPTTTGSLVYTSQSYADEHWRMVLAAADGTDRTNDYDTIHFEWPEIIGLTVAVSDEMRFPPTTPDSAPVVSQTPRPLLTNCGNVRIDISTETDKATDATAWSCIGTGNPLASDIHLTHEDAYTGDYATMPPLNLNVTGFGYRHATLDLEAPGDCSGSTGVKELIGEFKTSEEVGAGLCTLSDIIVTAVHATK